jgi:hypothetical protein
MDDDRAHDEVEDAEQREGGAQRDQNPRITLGE